LSFNRTQTRVVIGLLTGHNTLRRYLHIMGLCNDLMCRKCGKAIPLQAWTGPEGSRRLRLPHFKTISNEGGEVVSPRHRPLLPPGNVPGTHFC